MNMIDRVVGWFSPRRAAERESWRQYDAAIRSIGYDAGARHPSNGSWPAITQSAEFTDRYDRDMVRNRARDLERNSDIAASILSAYKRNVVGRGFTLQAHTKDDALNSQIDELWREWCKGKNCDVTGQQSFTQMLRMAVERKKIDGGMLIHKCYTKGGLLPFKLQALEVDELCTIWSTPHGKGNKVVGGIEYNQYNKPVGYWVQQYSIDGWATETPIFYPATDMIFYYTKRRPSQIREMSDMSVSLSRIRDINEFINAVAIKERVAACLAVFIKKQTPSVGVGRQNTAAATQHNYDGKSLAPGMISELNANDSIEVVNPGSSSSEAAAFLRTEQQLTGAGQGLAYETISRDMSGSTYSSARQGSIEDELTFYEEIELLEENVMDEIYETFVISAVLAGLLPIPDFWENKTKYLRHEWIASQKKWVDPQKEATAQQTSLQNGLKTYKQIAAENGRDWRTMLNDIAEVSAYADRLGLKIVGINAASAAGGGGDGNAGDDSADDQADTGDEENDDGSGDSSENDESEGNDNA